MSKSFRRDVDKVERKARVAIRSQKREFYQRHNVHSFDNDDDELNIHRLIRTMNIRQNTV